MVLHSRGPACSCNCESRPRLAVGERAQLSAVHFPGVAVSAGPDQPLSPMFDAIIVELVQVLITAAGAPLCVGVIRKLKARMQGRRGPGVLQPYKDLRKLLSKESVISENTSWILRFTPYLLVACMLL